VTLTNIKPVVDRTGKVRRYLQVKGQKRRAITTTTGGTGPHKLAVAIAFQK
jgi:hypothetical protein